jgi:glucuronate isomerase
MRANGVPERFITGNASDYEKFLAFARTVPATVRNPLYHWTHLELSRYFGITELLNEESAPRVWAQANEQLQELTVHRILQKFRVSVICTTDDPADDLSHHRTIRTSRLATRVYPAFRPDKVFAIEQRDAFQAWVGGLETVTGRNGSELAGLFDALRDRHVFFGSLGTKLSDHGIPFCYSEPCEEAEASAIYERACSGVPLDDTDALKFRSFMLRFFGELDADTRMDQTVALGRAP